MSINTYLYLNKYYEIKIKPLRVHRKYNFGVVLSIICVIGVSLGQ